jgi:hypothetical protein
METSAEEGLRELTADQGFLQPLSFVLVLASILEMPLLQPPSLDPHRYQLLFAAALHFSSPRNQRTCTPTVTKHESPASSV